MKLRVHTINFLGWPGVLILQLGLSPEGGCSESHFLLFYKFCEFLAHSTIVVLSEKITMLHRVSDDEF
jgi:hypothetical protein